MPFKSKAQRDFLKINNPNVYKSWVAKHGVAIKKNIGSKLSLKKTQTRRKKK
jgi:hypothetical protein